MRRVSSVVVALTIALDVSAAHSQDIFRRDILLLPTGATFKGPSDQHGTPQAFLPQAIDNAGYIYNAGQGGVQCYHPSDPDATLRIFKGDNFYDANGSLRGLLGSFVQTTADGTGVEAAFVPAQLDLPGTNFERVRVFRFDCTMLSFDGQGGTGGRRVGGDIRANDDPLFARTFGTTFIKRGPNTFCFATSGVVCIDLSGETPSATQIVTPSALDALIEPAHIDWVQGISPIVQDWWLTSLMSLPDGRVYFIADFEYGSNVRATKRLRYIVERRADGTLDARFGPVMQSIGSFGLTPLETAGQLLYHAGLDALLAWPVTRNEFSWTSWYQGLAGWEGYGFRVLPVGAPGAKDLGSGYLGLSVPLSPLLERCVDAGGACSPLGAVIFDGKLLVSVKASGNPNTLDAEIYEVYFDKDRLDLDDDGLSAAEERGVGTSDTQPDSDFGATPDGIEVHVSETDATSARGEPSRTRADPPFGMVSYVPSPLIQKKLPALDYDAMQPLSTLTSGIAGPMCMGGACYGPGGDVVFRYPADRTDTGLAVVSFDGTFIMLDTPAGLVRFWFDDGREELAVTRAAFDGFVPTSQFTRKFIPIDGVRTWLISNGSDHPERYPATVALAEGDDITVIYDHARSQRDSGLRNAAGEPVADIGLNVFDTIEILGWNDVTEQLHIGVYANWETYLLGVGADRTVTVLSRARALKGINGEERAYLHGQLSFGPPELPLYIRPSGHGDFFTSGNVMEPYGGFLPTGGTAHIVHERETGQFQVTPLERVPLGIWGDVVLEVVCCGYVEDGFFELVRYDQSVAPGDLLVLRPGGTGGSMLSRIGPRGGIADLWQSDSQDIVGIAGMDLAQDGSMRLCVADEGAGMLWELEPAGPRGAPEIIRYSEAVSGIVDCAYETDGTLRVLARDPARTLLRPAGDDFASLMPGDAMTPNPDPIELVRAPDGTLETRREDDGLRGKAYLPDGRALTMGEGDFTLLVEGGAAVGLPPLVFQNYLPGAGIGSAHAARVSFAVRPDGLVVVVSHHAEAKPPYAVLGRVYAVDVADQGVHDLIAGSLGGGGGLAIAMVPGGVGADPWTGAIETRATLPPNIPNPVVPGAPAGGALVAAEGGCATGRSSLWAAALGLLLGWVLARRAGLSSRASPT